MMDDATREKLSRLKTLRIRMLQSADTARERAQTDEYDDWDTMWRLVFSRPNIT